MTSVINTGLKNEINRDWKSPKISVERAKNLGWVSPILEEVKAKVTSADKPHNTALDLVEEFKDVVKFLREAHKQAKKDIDDKVWDEGTWASWWGKGGEKKSEAQVKAWEENLDWVCIYLERKIEKHETTTP